jgi:hypothetical protein
MQIWDRRDTWSYNKERKGEKRERKKVRYEDRERKTRRDQEDKDGVSGRRTISLIFQDPH